MSETTDNEKLAQAGESTGDHLVNKPTISEDKTSQPSSNNGPASSYSDVSEKDRLVCFILAFFLGTFGVHRMYAGRVTSGILQLFFGIFTLYIWNFVDFILILCGSFKDSEGKYIRQWVH